MKFILGLKLGISQIFDEKGSPVPVTLIEAGPCVITQIKTKRETDTKLFKLDLKKLKRKRKLKSP